MVETPWPQVRRARTYPSPIKVAIPCRRSVEQPLTEFLLQSLHCLTDRWLRPGLAISSSWGIRSRTNWHTSPARGHQMRRVIGLSVAALLTAGALLAQEDGGGRGVARAGPPPPCPPNGYGAQAYYALFGQNGGDGLTAYEIASPCIGKDVREVAESIGMGRSKLLGVKNVIGVQFKANGTMALGAGGTETARLANAEFHIAYYIPAMRMFLNGTKVNGQPLKEIRVFANQYAWNEAQEGRGATGAMNTLNDRLPLIKLTPFGAMWSVIEAEGHAVVSKTADGKTVLTGTSPYDGIEVAVTVEDSKQHPKLGPYGTTELIRLPVAVTAKANGHVYGATFADYRGDLEPNVRMIFPTHLQWRQHGKSLAAL